MRLALVNMLLGPVAQRADHAVAVGIRVIPLIDQGDHFDTGYFEPGRAQTLAERARQMRMWTMAIPDLDDPPHPLRIARVPYARFPIRVDHGDPAAGTHDPMELEQRNIDVGDILVHLRAHCCME